MQTIQANPELKSERPGSNEDQTSSETMFISWRCHHLPLASTDYDMVIVEFDGLQSASQDH